MNRLLLTGVLAMVCFACATVADSDDAREQELGALYMRHAGMHQDQVRFTRIRGWETAGQRAVLVDFGGRGHYLIELPPQCLIELHTTPVMTIHNQERNVVTRFDRIAIGREVCQISSIRSVDIAALRAEQEALGGFRGQRGEVRDQGSGGT